MIESVLLRLVRARLHARGHAVEHEHVLIACKAALRRDSRW
jgi:hypothetical protein